MTSCFKEKSGGKRVSGTEDQMPARHAREKAGTRGFTLIELVIVCLILAAASAITLISFSPAMKSIRVGNAFQTVVSTIDVARGRATSMRRVYAVNFIAPRTITITDAATPALAPIVTRSLPSDVSFDAEPGIPATNATAPDRLGNGQPDGPICFDIGVTLNCATTVLFYPDGSARDAAGNVSNGVVYIAQTNDLMSSRAITVMGLTGRVRGWRLNNNPVAGNTYWRQQ
jgi:prepilin-type N-terminal cleavage/methylation domain-containing protein